MEMLELRVLLAGIVYVDDSAPAGGDGSSWDLAYRALQSALGVAVSGDQIRVGQGTYKPTSGGDRTIAFVLANGVELYGGYAGQGAADPYARDVAAYRSILSGNIGLLGATNDNTNHVVVGSGTNATAVMDGFTIRDGYAIGAGGDYGGGMYNNTGSPTVRNCTFTANYAVGGAAMANTGASPTVISCTFNANSVVNDGAAIYNSNHATPLINSCTFTGNSATAGGAIYNTASSPVIRQCVFTGNGASSGGAMHSRSDSEPVLIDCTFTRNTAAQGGGAIYNHMSPIWSNYNYRSHYINCTFNGNTTSRSGGAIENVYSNVVLSNCVFSGNDARYDGGAVANVSYSASRLVNCSFSGNEARGESTSDGGAFYNSDHSNPILSNCIFWGNLSTDGNEIYVAGGTCAVYYCDVQGGWGLPADHNMNSDPFFYTQPNPGADGEWGTVDDQYGDFHLQGLSPCIDAADNGLVRSDLADLDGDGNFAEPTPYDRDGHQRFVDLPVPDTGAGAAPIADIGAYEASSPGSHVTITGTGGADHYYVRRSADLSELQIWLGTEPVGAPVQSFVWGTVLSCTFDTGAGEDSLSVDFVNNTPIPAGGLVFLSGSDHDQLILLNTAADANLSITSDQAEYSGRAIPCDDAEEIVLGGTGNVHLAALSLGGQALDPVMVSIPPAGNRALFAGSVAIGDWASLDVNDNDLVVRATAATRDAVLASLGSSIAAARNTALLWHGRGLTSTAAAGNLLTGLAAVINDSGSSTLLAGLFGKVLDRNCVVVKYTWNGDANLSGSIDVDDYFQIDRGFVSQSTPSPLRGYRNGDFDYSGSIDGDDYFLIDRAFMGQTGVLLLPAMMGPTPPVVPAQKQTKAATAAKPTKPTKSVARQLQVSLAHTQPVRSIKAAKLGR